MSQLDQLRQMISNLHSLLTGVHCSEANFISWQTLLMRRLNELKDLLGWKTGDEWFAAADKVLIELKEEADRLMSSDEDVGVGVYHKGRRDAYEGLMSELRKEIKG